MSGGETIPEVVRRWADSTPDAPAIKSLHDAPMTYSTLAILMDSVAQAIEAVGVSAQDRVAIVLPNGPLMATAFLATTCAATAAPLNPGLTEAEFAYYFEDLGATLVLVADDDATSATTVAERMNIEVLRVTSDGSGLSGSFRLGPAQGNARPKGSEPSDIALVLHTSGTTGRPKIVPLTHSNLTHSASNVAQTLKLSPDDRCLSVMPLFHIHGLVAALLASLAAGASIVCTTGFSGASFLDWIEAHGPTWYTAVPTMHQAVLARFDEDSQPAHTLRFIRSSSASIPPTVLSELESRFSVPVIEAYGMTEAAHQMTSNRLPPETRKSGSVGAAAGPEVSIVDENGTFQGGGETGEVVIRGNNVTAGYHGVADGATQSVGDRWFRTGDQGFIDEDGYLFLTGRLKEIINRGGETIAPREIDEALLGIDGITQAVAFAVPDKVFGEEVAAVVTLRSGASISEAEIQAGVSDRLSFAKTPKRVVIATEIPKGPTGKLQRIGLADKLGLTAVRRESAGDGVIASPTGETLAALWIEVLEVAGVGLDDAFLESGGDSLSATALAVRVEEEFAIDLPLLAFYNAATIRLQAELIDHLVVPARE